jgi:hypothetical protein
VNDSWTLQELVTEAGARLAALPAPKNGQVRAIPDDRTIRYYAAIGLLDRPAAMRGRTALYALRHLAQVVAIKRMQSAGKTLAEIQELWTTIDDATLSRMSGVELQGRSRAARKDFWKRDVDVTASAKPSVTAGVSPAASVLDGSAASAGPGAVELRIELVPGAFLTVSVADGVSLTSADVRALRAAAAPLATELANRGLTAPVSGRMEQP